MSIARRSLVSALALVLVVAGTASAQVVQRPPRAYRNLFGSAPLDPNRARQEFTVFGSLLGSFDDNFTPPTTSPEDLFTPRPSGVTGVGEARLRYWRGKPTSSIDITGGGALYTFFNLGLSPEYAADVLARGTMPVGRRHQLIASQEIRLEPFYMFGSFAPLLPGLEAEAPPPPSSASGFVVRRSRVLDTRVSFAGNLSRNHTLSLVGEFYDRDFSDGLGNNRSVSGSADYSYLLDRGSTIRATYRYDDGSNFNEDGVNRPVAYQTFSGGYTHEKRFSATRRFLVAFGGGTTRVRTTVEPFLYWTPTGYASLRFDWARSWSIWGDYSRRVAVLEGLTVDPFTTDSIAVRTGGLVHPRVELVGSGGWSNGQAAPDTVGRIETYFVLSQLRVFIARWYSLVVSHTFYAQRLDQVGDPSDELLRELDQNSIRLGFTFDLPVRARYIERARP